MSRGSRHRTIWSRYGIDVENKEEEDDDDDENDESDDGFGVTTEQMLELQASRIWSETPPNYHGTIQGE